ncbi:MAG: TetR/AcrR family transcriptional regulator [Balneolaceae bacterium]|nr:TetR/AcrR family transcriptional regulator [Balneolaceae bacterium]
MSKENEQNLKEKILESSRRQLFEEGYRNFSLRKIAREVGVTATSIYLHFDSKDHLLHTLMEESIEELNNQLQDAVLDLFDPIKKLEALAHVYVNFALKNPREYQILYMVSSDEMSRYPKEKFRQARRGYEIVTDTLQEGVSKNLLDEPRPRIAAYTFWAQLHGVMSVVLSKRLDNRIDQQEFIKDAIEHIIQGFHVRTALDAN